eukprot:gene11173-3994_t
MGNTIIHNHHVAETPKIFNWKNFTIGAVVVAYFKYKEHTNKLLKTTYTSKKMILLALEETPLSFKDIPLNFSEDIEVASKIVSRNGMELKNASYFLKDNKNVCLCAVGNDGNSLKFVSKRLKEDFDVCFVAVSNNGLALKQAGTNAKKNPEIVMAAVKENLNSAQYAEKSVFLDKSLMSEIERLCKEFKNFQQFKEMVNHSIN